MSATATSHTTLPVDEPLKARANRLEALTGLRVLAAVAVYLTHLREWKGAPEAVKTFLLSGYMGVTMFFVLSGFVLSLNYFDALRRPTPTKVWNYAVARVARVYPLYIVVLVYLIVRLRTSGATGEGWLPHALLVQAWDPSENAFAFNPPGWSVSVELFMYACFPLLVVLLARVRSTRALLCAAAIVALAMLALTAWFVYAQPERLHFDPKSSYRWLYHMPLTRLGDLLLGMLAARLYLNLRGRPRAPRVGAALAIAAFVVIVGLMSWPAHFLSDWSWDVSYAIPSAILVFGLAMAPLSLPSRLLSRPTMVLLGESSYAFYLIHFQLMIFLNASLWATTGITPMVLVYEALTLGLVLAVSVGVHILLEKPARVWIRRLALRRTPAPVAAGADASFRPDRPRPGAAGSDPSDAALARPSPGTARR